MSWHRVMEKRTGRAIIVAGTCSGSQRPNSGHLVTKFVMFQLYRMFGKVLSLRDKGGIERASILQDLNIKRSVDNNKLKT